MMVDLTSQIAEITWKVCRKESEMLPKYPEEEPEDVCLVVVSKAQPVNIIQAAYQSGVRRFGENYPLEAEKKIVELGQIADIEWHMIGHLQSRKIPIIVEIFSLYPFC